MFHRGNLSELAPCNHGFFHVDDSLALSLRTYVCTYMASNKKQGVMRRAAPDRCGFASPASSDSTPLWDEESWRWKPLPVLSPQPLSSPSLPLSLSPPGGGEGVLSTTSFISVVLLFAALKSHPRHRHTWILTHALEAKNQKYLVRRLYLHTLEKVSFSSSSNHIRLHRSPVEEAWLGCGPRIATDDRERPRRMGTSARYGSSQPAYPCNAAARHRLGANQSTMKRSSNTVIHTTCCVLCR